MKKGFYIKKGKRDQSIYLHICKVDFIQYLNDICQDEWVKFRIYERDQPDSRGFTHNMETIQNITFQAENETKAAND
jgi:hypothetical protein